MDEADFAKFGERELACSPQPGGRGGGGAATYH